MKIINNGFQQEIIKTAFNIFVPDDFRPLLNKPKAGHKWIWIDFDNAEYAEVSKYIFNKISLEKRAVINVEDLSLEEWTPKVPRCICPTWDSDSECWVTNQQAQYEAQVQQVDATRRALYTNVDALRNEAVMIRAVENDETKAADYDEQAKALYLKIRDENPWPEPPIE